MSQFFNGWRRKFGVVMLVPTCLLSMVWVRSLIIGDQFGIEVPHASNLSLSRNYFLTSKGGCIRWSEYGILSNGVNPSAVNPKSIWTTVPINLPSEPFDEFTDTSAYRPINTRSSIIEIRKGFVGEHYWHWRWQWLNFDFGKGQAYGDAPMFVWVVPYWSITIPLTALSAFLLLTKPRNSNPMQITEPIQDERGGAAS